jgi:hypothetical protein
MLPWLKFFSAHDSEMMQLVVVHADLIGHLKALKDYFLLAKGDFFQASISASCYEYLQISSFSELDANLLLE